ncbi:MAG TPA: flagellar export protein FliJ [Humisphaera sp.]|jgi:flagellar FliJ protein|nr:flagellar export protein FliJ [Humisphaera sp.]
MAQFKFQLAAVLRHRKHVEQERQRALAELESEMAAQQRVLDEMNRSVVSSADDLRKNRLTGPLNLAYLTAHRRYMLGMQRQMMALAQKMSLLQRKIDDARTSLVEAARERKVMEKLRDRQHGAWQEDQNRRELAEMDDLTMRAAAWAALGIDGQSTES